MARGRQRRLPARRSHLRSATTAPLRWSRPRCDRPWHTRESARRDDSQHSPNLVGLGRHGSRSVYVDRVGWEGARKTTNSPTTVAARIAAADDIASSVRCWPELIENGPLTFLEANTLGPLMSPGAKAGVVGRWMSLGHYDLAPDQALVIRIPPTGAPIRAASSPTSGSALLEYASATSSITAQRPITPPTAFSTSS